MKKKKCKRCEETKPLTDYHKSNTYKDGYTYYCKTCIAEKTKIDYYENGGQKKASEYYYNYTKKGLKKPKQESENTKLLREGKLRCGGCSKVKGTKEFCKDKRRKYKHSFYCKVCRKEIRELKKNAH